MIYLFTIMIFILAGPGWVLGQEVLSWEDCVREAAQNNPDLAAARASVHQARFRYQASYGNFLPQLSLSAGYDRAGSETNLNLLGRGSVIQEEYNLGLTLNQSLFSGFRHVASVERSRADLEATEANLLAVNAQVSFDLKSAFAQLLFAQGQLELANAISARRKENVDLVELRFEAGREHKGSFLRSRAAYREAVFEVTQAERALKVAQRQLAKVLGRRESTDLRVSGTFEVMPPGAPPDFHALARQTPAYLLSAAQARSTQADVTIARSAFFPEVAATGSVFRSGDDFPPDRDRWTTGILLTFPLFSGGQSFFDLQGARAGNRRAQELLEGTEDQAVLDLERTFAAFQDSIERVSVREEFLKAGEVRAEIARSLYTSGLLTFDDWDLIENDLISVRKEMLVSLRDRLASEAAWERVQGKGSIP